MIPVPFPYEYVGGGYFREKTSDPTSKANIIAASDIIQEVMSHTLAYMVSLPLPEILAFMQECAAFKVTPDVSPDEVAYASDTARHLLQKTLLLVNLRKSI